MHCCGTATSGIEPGRLLVRVYLPALAYGRLRERSRELDELTAQF
jgi:hypothetical protein